MRKIIPLVLTLFLASPAVAIPDTPWNRTVATILMGPHTQTVKCVGPVCITELRPKDSPYRLLRVATDHDERLFICKGKQSCKEVH